MSLLEVHGLKKVYTSRFGGQSVQALSNVNFSVEQGDVLTIRGLGKCCLAEVGGQSRKGRTGIMMKRFI